MIEISTDLVEYSVDRSGDPVIHIFGRDKDGNAQQINVYGFRPYFYTSIDPNALTTTEEDPWIDEIELTSTQVNIQGDPVWKVFLKSPYHATIAQQKFVHYEADISYADRFVIDTGINNGVRAPSSECLVSEIEPINIITPLRVCIIDIEVDSQHIFPKPEKNKINCVTCHDSFTGVYDIFYLVNDENNIRDASALTCNTWFDPERIRLHVFLTEQDMLKALQEYVKTIDPDVLTGWNFTDFDMPYIMKRMDVLGLKPMEMGRLRGRFNPQWCSLKGRSEFDMLGGYKKITGGGKMSYRLDAIAEEEVDEHKVRYSGTIHDLWRDDPAKLIEYNWKDVELCVKIDAKVRIVDFCRMLARHVGCSIDRALHNSKIVDMYILNYAHGRYVLPSAPKLMAEDDKFEGATVMDPFSGLEEYVIVLDLDSMYPTIMDTINASPETKDQDGKYHAPNGVRFKDKPDGITREIMRKLSKERKELKKIRDSYEEHDSEYVLYDMQQRVIKEIMNSYYGVSGYIKFRLYDQDFGGAVTSTGRAIINHTKQIVERHGYTVLYGDTDSVFVKLNVTSKEEALKIGFEIAEIVNASYDAFAHETLGVTEHKIHIKFEKLYRRFFQTGRKKRYAVHIIWKEGVDFDKTDISGFEFKRSDTPAVVKRVQFTLLEKIIHGEDEDEIKTYLRDEIRKYRSGKYSLDEIGIPGGISKDLDAYDKPDSCVRGAIYANTYLNAHFGAGSKPKRVYISTVKRQYPKTDVVCFEYGDEVPDVFVIDIKKMFEKSFRGPIERITKALGWEWEEFDPSMTTLASFGLS